MSRPSAPVLTVRSGRSQGSFAAGREVVVGSDLRADLRVAHPLVARAHLLLRYDQDKWIAVDNNSQNGIYVDGQRVSTVDIQDGQTINIGKPDGPRVTFEVGHHRGIVGLLPPTETFRALTLPPGPPGGAPASEPRPDGPPSRPQPAYPPPAAPGTGPRPHHPHHPRRPPPPTQPPTVAQVPYLRPEYAQRTTAVPLIPPVGAARPGRQPVPQPTLASPGYMAQDTTVSQVPTRMLDFLVPGEAGVPAASCIGRALDNDIVVHDVLASRHHAALTPTPIGTEIRDADSINGTFVNGIRVGSAILSEGDVVTIGNVDLVFNGGILVPRTEAAANSQSAQSCNATPSGAAARIRSPRSARRSPTCDCGHRF